MKVVRQARLELSGGSTPDQLRPPHACVSVRAPCRRSWRLPPFPACSPKEVWIAKSLLPPGGFRCVGRAAHPLFSPGRHAVPNAPAGGALPSAMDAAPGAAGSGAARCVPIGLPAPGGTGAAAPAPLSTFAAPAGAARPASGRRRGRGPHGTAAASGSVCATPSPALCRLRAAGRRALLPAGSRRAPHGRGAKCAWRRKCCGRGCSRRGPAPLRRPRLRGACQVRKRPRS